MIPPLEDNGYLPPGIHRAPLDEIEARFGSESELRQVQMESLHWLVDLARQAGIRRLVLDGSFVTETYEPNDVDCVLLLEPDRSYDHSALDEIADGFPFLEVQLVEPPEFSLLVEQFFATDRQNIPKGLVEVDL